MKVFAYVALASVLTGFVIWGANSFHNAGLNKARLACSNEREATATLHAKNLERMLQRQTELTRARDEIARLFIKQSIEGAQQNEILQNELAQLQSVTEPGDCSILSNAAVRVLHECTDAAGVPVGSEPSFTGKDTATTTDLARYACYAAGEYNQCAREVNAAIRELAQ